MADAATLAEIDRRIQIVEDNLRQLIEQAAAYSGAADEEAQLDEGGQTPGELMVVTDARIVGHLLGRAFSLTFPDHVAV